MKPVLYRYRDSESVIKQMDGYTPPEGWTLLYSQDQVDKAVDAALERAIQACKNVARKQGTISRQLAAMECGEIIGTLKESKE